MSTGGRLTFKDANFHAAAFRALFVECYEHWTVAGSIRRIAATVNDIDHVVIPKSLDVCQETMFGTESIGTANSVWSTMDRLITVGTLSKALYGADADPDPTSGESGGRTRYGPLLRSVVFENVTHEVSCVTRNNLGAMIALKTGPAGFSRYLVTKLRDGRRYRQEGGYVRYNKDDAVRAVLTELDYFALCGVSWITPEKRERFAALLPRE